MYKYLDLAIPFPGICAEVDRGCTTDVCVSLIPAAVFLIIHIGTISQPSVREGLKNDPLVSRRMFKRSKPDGNAGGNGTDRSSCVLNNYYVRGIGLHAFPAQLI